MKFKTTQVKETELDIPIPSFYQDKRYLPKINEMIGILDENTICQVWESEHRTLVENSDKETGATNEIVKAFLNWDKITEEEFLTAYDRAITSMLLTPQIIKDGKPKSTEDDLKGIFGTESVL